MERTRSKKDFEQDRRKGITNQFENKITMPRTVGVHLRYNSLIWAEMLHLRYNSLIWAEMLVRDCATYQLSDSAANDALAAAGEAHSALAIERSSNGVPMHEGSR